MNPATKKISTRTLCTAAFILLCGCATPPAPEPAAVEIPQTFFEDFQASAAALLDSGMLAAVGSAESKSPELAHNRALTDGRRRLARLLEAKIDLLRRSAADETGKPADDPVFNPLDTIAQTMIRDRIQSLSPTRIEEETISGTVYVYGLMQLNPQLIIDQLIKEKALYELLKPTQAFILLFRNIGTLEAASAE